jgi:hypothetical protein
VGQPSGVMSRQDLPRPSFSRERYDAAMRRIVAGVTHREDDRRASRGDPPGAGRRSVRPATDRHVGPPAPRRRRCLGPRWRSARPWGRPCCSCARRAAPLDRWVAAAGWTAGDDGLRPSVRTFEVAAIPTGSLGKLFDGPEAWLKGGNQGAWPEPFRCPAVCGSDLSVDGKAHPGDQSSSRRHGLRRS